eukprot:scaffold216433_cov64-Attheya_sp.AAC.1
MFRWPPVKPPQHLRSSWILTVIKVHTPKIQGYYATIDDSGNQVSELVGMQVLCATTQLGKKY